MAGATTGACRALDDSREKDARDDEGGEEGGSAIAGPRQNIYRSPRQSYKKLSYAYKLLTPL